MNCLQFRRQLMEDPYSYDEEIQEHESACSQCATFARELRADEVMLRQALQDVPVPPELSESIQLAISFEQRGRARRRIWYASAASILMLIVISMASLVNTSYERDQMALAQSVVHHIEDEAHHLRESGPVQAARVKYVFQRFGASLKRDIGPVNFAAECLMRHQNGVHLVISGEMGPITVFFMPGEHLQSSAVVQSDRFSGEIRPTPWGSVAVVGERGEQLAGITRRMVDAVDWPDDSGVSGQPLLGRINRAAVLGPMIAEQ